MARSAGITHRCRHGRATDLGYGAFVVWQGRRARWSRPPWRTHVGPSCRPRHHVIFHWNRLGLSYETQSVLAAAAREAVLG
jgi:hypothetical protein